ncbi:MAG: hypothetical protein FWC27_07820 [Firmicutes bacterium]|nr:hypothetical protein [Bacillota bacterium]
MPNISGNDCDNAVMDDIQAWAAIAIKHMQANAVKEGLDCMTLDEINAEIAAARKEMAKDTPHAI